MSLWSVHVAVAGMNGEYAVRAGHASMHFIWAVNKDVHRKDRTRQDAARTFQAAISMAVHWR